ncbi:MAG: acyl carrier protein [Acidobacteria bacterium]|nr:acyl carrier protein [Acidobacteriota bacterium]
MIERVISVIAETQRLGKEKVSLDSSFEELGMDSMDGVNVLFALENEFDINIPDEEARAVRTVRGMAEGVAKLVAAKARSAATAE